MLTPTVPRLDAPPVRLRAFEDKDAGLIASVVDDPLIPEITTVPRGGGPAEIEAYLERQQRRLPDFWGYSFAIADHDTDEAVGQVSLALRNLDLGRASVGYWVASQFRGRGYARAALETVTEWALSFEQLDRLELYVEPWNEASWRTAEACGYEREGLLRRWGMVGEDRRDMFIYSRLSER
ncbi:GNAT family N-acetyltransferase [Actinomycetota bacterium]